MKHLTQEQRCEISANMKVGLSQKEIAKFLQVPPSTISREIKRTHTPNWADSAQYAHANYEDKKIRFRSPRKFIQGIRLYVEKLLREA